MQILFVSDAPVYGGHEAMAVAAAEGLCVAGHDVSFEFYRGNKRLQTALEAVAKLCSGLRLRPSDLRSQRLNTVVALFSWRLCWRLSRHFKSVKPDLIIVVQGRIESGAAVLIAVRLAGIRSLSYLPMAHRLVDVKARPLPGLRDVLNRLFYRLPDSYVTISPAIERQIRHFAPEARVGIVENLVERSRHSESRMQARLLLRLPPDARILAIIGRVDFHQKGQDRAIEAIKAAALSNVHLLIVGEGPHRGAVESMARDPAVAGRVHYRPWTPEMDTVYDAADAVMLPSNYEGVPLVMTEALIRRKVVIAARRDGMADWLPTPTLFDADEASIATAVSFALSANALAALQPAFDHAQRLEGKTRYSKDWDAAVLAAAMAR